MRKVPISYYKSRLVEYCSSGKDVSVNTVIILRGILADLRSEATEEARMNVSLKNNFAQLWCTCK